MEIHSLKRKSTFFKCPGVAHEAPLSVWFSLIRILEWVTISSSRGSSPSRIEPALQADRFFTSEPYGLPTKIFTSAFILWGAAVPHIGGKKPGGRWGPFVLFNLFLIFPGQEGKLASCWGWTLTKNPHSPE